MGRSHELPDELGEAFRVDLARRHGVTRSRLRGGDLRAPFPGVRISSSLVSDSEAEVRDPYERQRRLRVLRARDYAPRLHTGHFFSHDTAASIWGAPLPLAIGADGQPAGADDLELHVTAPGHLGIPRTAGVTGHRSRLSMAATREHDGLRVSSPAMTWALLGHLSLYDSIALGDFFCRAWRDGFGRPTPGRAPLATRAELAEALDAGRRRGAEMLRTALERVREDSWSPRETLVRCIIVDAGLPEPELNADVFDRSGRFLGCVDLVYPDARVGIEYLGMLHDEAWARDVERIAALRAAGWTIIEVTSPLVRRPAELVRRVSAALRR